MSNRTSSGTRRSGSSPGEARKARSGPSLREELEKAADGLSYISESDYPFKFFTLPGGSDPGLTAEGFLSCLGLSQALIDELNLPIEKLIEERPLEGFLPSVDDLVGYHGTDATDPEVLSESKKYRNLEAVLRKRLREVKVFRVGMVEIHCYLAGLDEHGDIAGVVTVAVET